MSGVTSAPLKQHDINSTSLISGHQQDFFILLCFWANGIKKIKKHGNFLTKNTASFVHKLCLALQFCVIQLIVTELQYHRSAMDKSGTISDRKLQWFSDFIEPLYLIRAKPGSHYICCTGNIFFLKLFPHLFYFPLKQKPFKMNPIALSWNPFLYTIN